jgi:hypothetical protein
MRKFAAIILILIIIIVCYCSLYYPNTLQVLTFVSVIIGLLVTLFTSNQLEIFNSNIESVKAKNQFRLACLDRRLQAHQEAFGLWSELMKCPSEQFLEVHARSSRWWDNNCIYLEQEVSKAFRESLSAIHQHHLLIHVRGSDDIQIQKRFSEFEVFPKILFNAIQFPNLAELK